MKGFLYFQVQEQGFAGVLFASIQPSTTVKQSPKLHSHTAFYANNGRKKRFYIFVTYFILMFTLAR